MRQAQWSTVLLNPELEVPEGVVIWNNSDPLPRFNVYRNNIVVSLIDALADTFPVSQALVGEEFFLDMAREFVRRRPPTSPVLARFGQEFPQFIEAFSPAAAVPYLTDVARLEMAYLDAYHAADVVPVAADTLSDALQDAELLETYTCSLHPSLIAIESPYAIGALWAAHQGELDIAGVNPFRPECVWVLRQGLAVKVYGRRAGEVRFVLALQRGDTLGAAIELAQADDAEFDLTRCLSLLLRDDAIVSLTKPPPS